MARTPKKYIFNQSYRDPSLTPQQRSDELMNEYRRLANVANRRLRQIDLLKNEPGFKNVDKYSYAKAQRDIKQMGGKSKYFPTRQIKKADGTVNESIIKARINDMLDFINAETSTKTGIIKTYQSRADTINERYGTDFTWQDLETLMSTSRFKNLEKMYGSKTALVMIGRLQHDPEELANVIGKTTKGIQRMKKENVNKAIYKAMTKNRLDPGEILSE